jgi:N-acetylglucosaminyldiphosphoundecaprenol N-acetyl-beta-D-mannosaminyltransferase
MIATCPQPKANVLGIPIDAVDMESAIRSLDAIMARDQKGYVCLAGVHGIMEAHRDKVVAHSLANAALVIPDGMPTVWVGRLQGHAAMQQVTGPDLMLEVMQRPEFRGCTHFLYGGKEGVADELRAMLTERFPGVNIIGTYTPPFGPLSEAEEQQLIHTVNTLRPDILWVGISTPRQEQFMEQFLPRLEVKLMFGVGAAFDFHTGRIADCSTWIKRCGMQWFHRLLQDPRRLWWRYLRNNPAFLYAITLQLLGLRRYAHPQPTHSSVHSPSVVVMPASKS